LSLFGGRRAPLQSNGIPPDMPAALVRFLEVGEWSTELPDSMLFLGDPSDPKDARFVEAWRAAGAAITKRWIVEHPGKRPWAWWRVDSPERLRRHVGGGPGDLSHNVYDLGDCGLPGLSSLRTRDPNNPPLYEAQAVYLKRHALLEPGEEKRITAAGWLPEAIEIPVQTATVRGET
jgi:hypothetical protein